MDRKIKIMVGSTVYGFENELSQIVALLQSMGYENGVGIPKFTIDNNIVKVTFPNIIHLREGNNENDDMKQYFEGITEGITARARINFIKNYSYLHWR